MKKKTVKNIMESWNNERKSQKVICLLKQNKKLKVKKPSSKQKGDC